jgi:uncharacterized membrane protein YraQ (UPF0718 family)
MQKAVYILTAILAASWGILLDAAPYVIFGIVVAGVLKMFLSAQYVARHLGKGRVSSVMKAALFGIPLPLCSCGVLPAAASIRKQGANNGATTAFLIATPESGVDSIAITYALLDPFMTIARPVVAFVTAMTAGVTVNLLDPPEAGTVPSAAASCPVDNCCDGVDCSPEEHRGHHPLRERFAAGLRYAFTELWEDLAGWFMTGILLAGLIAAVVPDEIVTTHFGGGLKTMLLMLVVGIPLYICATASTPIAAALIMKGVSPGAALVFLLAGPATNVTSLSVLAGILGKRAAAIYLFSIAVISVLGGLALDLVYGGFGLSARALAGQSAEVIPGWIEIPAALLLIALSAAPIGRALKKQFARPGPERSGAPTGGCSSECCEGETAAGKETPSDRQDGT